MNPGASYTKSYNNRTTTVSVAAIPTPTPQPSPTAHFNGGGLCVAETSSPNFVDPGIPVTVTFTFYIEDRGSSTVHLAGANDMLPPGLTYANNSATSVNISFKKGVVLSNPITSMQNGQELLTWIFSSPLPSVATGDQARIILQASATPGEGTFQNQACVIAQPASIGTACTGNGADVFVGWRQYDIHTSAGSSAVNVRAEDQNGQYVIRSWQVP